MKLSSSLLLALLLQATSLCSGFQIQSTIVSTAPSNKQNYSNRVGPAIFGTIAASLLPHPKLARAIGVGSRVPIPTSPVSDLATVNKRVGQTAFLFVWTLFIVAALEWEGFDYFKHLVCRIKNMGKEEEIVDVGLPKESDWTSYSQQLQMSKKKYGIGARIATFLRRFSRSKVHAVNSAEIDKANKFFQDKQYEQHHHVVHVSRLKDEINRPNYLESLSSKYTSIDPNMEVKHNKSYLDSLSDLNAKKSSWADYKTVVDRVKKDQLNEQEALENEVSNLQNMMQIEQSMYQTSNQALKLALDAQNQQLQHVNDNSNSKATADLKAFDRIASEFGDTVGKEIAAKKAAGIIEDDPRSIVYEL